MVLPGWYIHVRILTELKRSAKSRSPTFATIPPPNILQRTSRPLYHPGIYTVPVSREGEHPFY